MLAPTNSSDWRGSWREATLAAAIDSPLQADMPAGERNHPVRIPRGSAKLGGAGRRPLLAGIKYLSAMARQCSLITPHRLGTDVVTVVTALDVWIVEYPVRRCEADHASDTWRCE
jgi:hypothetical protein